jgi:hypothetical protein
MLPGLLSATTYVGNNLRIRSTQPSILVGWKDEIWRFCGASNQVAGRNFEASGNPINCAKAGTLNSALQVANERPIKTSLQVEFHLRDAKLFPHRSHYFSKRPLHARTRLNLFATLGHLGEIVTCCRQQANW